MWHNPNPDEDCSGVSWQFLVTLVFDGMVFVTIKDMVYRADFNKLPNCIARSSSSDIIPATGYCPLSASVT